MPLSSTLKVEPLLNVISPVFRMPGLAPGATIEPLAAAVLPVTVPCPLSVWPFARTNVPLVSPVTSNIAPA